jgi:hypothetical protein
LMLEVEGPWAVVMTPDAVLPLGVNSASNDEFALMFCADLALLTERGLHGLRGLVRDDSWSILYIGLQVLFDLRIMLRDQLAVLINECAPARVGRLNETGSLIKVLIVKQHCSFSVLL